MRNDEVCCLRLSKHDIDLARSPHDITTDHTVSRSPLPPRIEDNIDTREIDRRFEQIKTKLGRNDGWMDSTEFQSSRTSCFEAAIKAMKQRDPSRRGRCNMTHRLNKT